MWGVAFERSGDRAASCSDDCTLRLWACEERDGEAWWRLLQVLDLQTPHALSLCVFCVLDWLHSS